MTFSKTLLAGAAAAVILGAGAAQAGVVNGGFESGTGDAGLGGYSTLNGGSTAVSGWTVTGASVDWINGYWQADEGTHSIDLNGLGVGGIEQAVVTTPGQTYHLSFSMSANPDQGADSRSMRVSVGGAPTDFTYNFTTPPNSHSTMNWAHDSLDFTAQGPTTLISFQSLSNGNCCWGPALDNVSLAAAGVPEPATWAMTILGMGLIGVSMRRRPALARVRA